MTTMAITTYAPVVIARLHPLVASRNQSVGCLNPLSTTTALQRQSGRGGVCSGCDERRLDDGDATATSASGRVLGTDRVAAPASAALRARSPESASHRPPFFGDRRSRHFEEGMRQQTERDVAMPALPGAHLVLIEPYLLVELEALLDLPASPRH